MNRFFQAALIATAAMAAVPAHATDFIFDTTNAGNNYTYTSTANGQTLNVKVSAYTRVFGDDMKKATVASFEHGLGIEQAGETTGGNYHQIDNVNGWEFLVLEFDKSVTLLGDRVNAFKLSDRDYVDADQYVGWGNVKGAWNAAGAQSTWDKVTASLTGHIDTTSNPALPGSSGYTTVDTPFNLTAASGNVWLIGAGVGTASNNMDGRNDAFKLAGFMARTNVAAVPEPATWAMMLVGFGMVGGASRYRRRKTVAAIA